MHLFPSYACCGRRVATVSSAHFLKGTLLALLLLSCLLAASCAGGIIAQPSPHATRTLSATPSSVNFGTVQIRKPSVLPTVIQNTGNRRVTVTRIGVKGSGFTLDIPKIPFALAPGQTVSLNAKFAPSSAGKHDGTISLVSNATNSPTVVSLSGIGASKTYSVGLAWSPPPSSSGVAGYDILRGNASSSGCAGINFSRAGSTSGVTSTTFTDKTVQGGHTYCYVVTAIVNNQQSPPSNVVKVTVPFS